MSTRLRSLVFALVVVCAVGFAGAQAPVDPLRAQQERDAEALFMQGEARMKVASYEEAIDEFRNVLKRYPATEMRYKAQFRMADALMALKKEPEAVSLLDTVVKEESPDWSPRALLKIGEIYAAQQRYSESFRAYREIIKDYPNNPMVDHAYFAIGVTHFRLGHFEQAAKELDKVGTVYAATVADLQRVSPGEPLYVRLTEPNMVATNETTVPVYLTARSGDKETVTLMPEVEGGDHFAGAIPTTLGAAKAGDGILQLHGNDLVTMKYKSRYIGDGAEERTMPMTVASNARVRARDSQGNEVKGVVVSDTMTVEVYDPDRDATDAADSLTVEVKTKRKDLETLTLKETGAHTGLFQSPIGILKTAPQQNSGKVETDAQLAEGASTQFDDLITIRYRDDQNLSVVDSGPRDVLLYIAIFDAANANMVPVEHQITRADLDIKALLYKGRSLTQIAATYRDLGQAALGTITFRKATAQFQEILTKYPNSPDVEEALYGLFQNYIEQGAYDAAISVINQIPRRFPQSTRAPEAMLQLAELHVKREEYDRALAIYNSLANTAKGTPLAEKAQYAICATYMTMFTPKVVSTERPTVTREQVSAALEAFVRNYPASELAPEAMWQLVRLRYDGEDYRGAVDTARRVMALYADSAMAGRVLLLMGQAQYKLRDIEGAKVTFRLIIANYGDQSEPATKLLTELERRFPPRTGTGTPADN